MSTSPGEAAPKPEEIPATMKRLVLVKLGEESANAEFRVETVPVPKVDFGEVLVRMVAAPVNPSDYQKWKFAPGQGNQLSEARPIGLEGSGVVVGNGGGTKGRSLVGKKVAFSLQAGTRNGTYQEYTVVQAKMAMEVFDDTRIEDACSAFINPFTVVGIAETAKSHGSPAFIHTAAASVLGQMLVKVSADMKITVVNLVRKETQVQLLKNLGAKYIINMSDKGWQEELAKLISDLRITVAFDCISGSIAGTLLSMLPPKSHLYNYGTLSNENICNIDPVDLIYRDKELQGFLLNRWLDTKGSFRKTMNMVMQNLSPGKWASSVFKDCTMDTMKEQFTEMSKTGFTGGKLRVRFAQS